MKNLVFLLLLLLLLLLFTIIIIYYYYDLLLSLSLLSLSLLSLSLSSSISLLSLSLSLLLLLLLLLLVCLLHNYLYVGRSNILMISHHSIVNGAWVLLPSMSLSPFVTTPSKTNNQIYFTISVNLTHQILVL